MWPDDRYTLRYFPSPTYTIEEQQRITARRGLAKFRAAFKSKRAARNRKNKLARMSRRTNR